MINTREIRNHYTINRGPQSILEFFCLLLYLPVGLIIFTFRLTLGFIVVLLSALVPYFPSFEQSLSGLLCNVFGVQTLVENPDKHENIKVLVSNYISPLDHLILHFVTGCVTPGNEFGNKLLSTSCGIRNFGSATTSFDGYKKNISSFISEGDSSLCIQPEFKMTNGKSLLKFKLWPFNLCDKVQPVCLKVNRSYFSFPVSTLESSYLVDIFWYMFFPKTTYEIKFLPVVHRGTMSDEEFSEKVRSDIATSLKIELSQYSASDLQEWEKRMAEERRRAEYPSIERISPATNSRYQIMANQVKEVLPMVPLNTIYTDLVNTRNVDQTITNILEGRVRYVPEPVPSSSSSSTTQTATPSKPFAPSSTGSKISANISAKNFGKSAHERTLSFQERKRALLDSARQKYIEKHGLNVVGSS